MRDERAIASPGRWLEIGDRTFVRHQPDLALNHGLVIGAERALVIDTGASAERGRELLASVEEMTDLPPVVVNTHAHYDHCFGNIAFRDAQVYAHADAAEHLLRTGEQQRAEAVAAGQVEGRTRHAEDVAETEIVLPFYLLEQDAPLDLGGRSVELICAAPAHTDHDLLVAVPDVGVVFWGDLIEVGAEPATEEGFAQHWGPELRRLVARPEIASAAIHVPGHGGLVDLGFVTAQADWLTERFG